jgi:hypothetical protein
MDWTIDVKQRLANGQPWRRRRFEAGFTDREDEGPTKLPVIEHCQHGPRQRQPRIARTPTPRPQPTATPIGSRYAVSPSTWPTCRRSPPGTARRWRCRRFVAGFTDRENEGPAELPVIEHCQHGPRQRQPWRTSATDACKQPEILTRPRHPRSAAGALSRLRPGPLAGDRHQAPLDAGAVVASWPASPIERTKDRPNCRRSSTASSPTSCPRHGNPDRQPVRCLAFDLAHLPAIATRHRSTLAPPSPRGRLHRSRKRRPDRTAGDRALPARATPAATLAHVCNRCLHAARYPDQATATPIGSRCAVSRSTWHHLPAIATRHRSTLAPLSLRGRLHRSRERRPDRTADGRALPARATPAATADCLHPESLTRPRHDRSAAVALSRVRPGTACRRSTPGTARRWRRRRFVAGFTDRENEGPTELPMVERCQHGPRQRQPRIARTPRSCPRHGNPDRQPVRCSRSPWHHLPAIATKHRSMLAPPSLRGRLHRSRKRRPDRTACDRALPAARHHDHSPRQPRSAAGALLAFALSPLAGDRHQAPLDAGAVVASWPASPIERTKARPNCRWSSAASTNHAGGNPGARLQPMPASTPRA